MLLVRLHVHIDLLKLKAYKLSKNSEADLSCQLVDLDLVLTTIIVLCYKRHARPNVL